MAAIENDRDIILQATSPRVVPVKITIDQVEGLPGKLEDIDSDISVLGEEVNGLMNNTKDLSIRASSLSVTNSTNTTLTVVRKNGITGTVDWSVYAGVATLSGTGDSRTIAGNTISGSSVTVRAAIGSKEVFATINKLGALSLQETVNLSSQVTGQLASGSVSGLGALALLNTVDLNTQTTGALNGQTQVTNLGTLAYANAIAANQIGAGTLAAGVIYAGTISADKITSGTITGRKITTATGGPRVEVLTGAQSGEIEVYSPSGLVTTISHYGIGLGGNASGGALRVQNFNTSGPLITLISRPGKPSSLTEGGISYSTTHGFIFCDGTGWFKPTSWTSV